MLIDKEKPFYNVTQVSELLGISPDRLRTYDEEKIVVPMRTENGGKRLYSELDIEWLKDVRSVIAKNRMNIYSLKLMFEVFGNLPPETIDKLIKNRTSDDTWIIFKRMLNNPNFKKLQNIISNSSL